MADDRHSGLAGLRILIVEDEAIIAMDLEYVLESAGAEIVGIAAGNAKACDLISTQSPDAVLLDYNLVDGDAAPTAHAACSAGVAVVFHSGHAVHDALQSQFPGTSVLSKPSQPRDLVRALRESVARRQMQGEHAATVQA